MASDYKRHPAGNYGVPGSDNRTSRTDAGDAAREAHRADTSPREDGKKRAARALANAHKERAKHRISSGSANAVVEKMKKTVASARQGQD